MAQMVASHPGVGWSAACHGMQGHGTGKRGPGQARCCTASQRLALTGCAPAVQMYYNPAECTFEQILDEFFQVSDELLCCLCG